MARSSDASLRRWLEDLEADARHRPARYRARLAGLAAIGYLYPSVVVGGTTLALALLVWFLPMTFAAEGPLVLVWLACACAAAWATWSVAQVFHSTIAEPRGVKLEPDAGAALRKLVEEVRHALGGVAVDELRVDMSFNASVAQYPALGLLGGVRNVLTLGLPLLAVHGPDELADVLAHEFGHLAGQHGRVDRWVYRLHHTWRALRQRESGDRSLSWWLLGWFLDRYPDHLAAVTLAWRRKHEYEADRAAAELRGASFARTLMRNALWADHLERTFWEEQVREAFRDAVPPADILERLRGFAAGPVPAPEAARWAARQIRLGTNIHADHPCLRERLGAMGAGDLLASDVDEARRAAPAPSALDLLIDAPHALDRAVRIWKADAAPAWRSRHVWLKQARAGLDQPRTGANETPADRAWRACEIALADLAGAEERAALEAFLTAHPAHARASFRLGLHLLDRDEDAGIAHLEAGMAKACDLVLPGLDRLLGFHRSRGEDDAGDVVRARVEKVLADGGPRRQVAV